MSALFTALVESESKESLAEMVCELREALRECLELMDLQEMREAGGLHIPAHTFGPMWDGAKEKGHTALSQLRQEG